MLNEEDALSRPFQSYIKIPWSVATKRSEEWNLMSYIDPFCTLTWNVEVWRREDEIADEEVDWKDDSDAKASESLQT